MYRSFILKVIDLLQMGNLRLVQVPSDILEFFIEGIVIFYDLIRDGDLLFQYLNGLLLTKRWSRGLLADEAHLIKVVLVS